MTLDVSLLRKAVEWAEAEAALPEIESAWYQKTWSITGASIDRTCDTAYCIAGWITHEAGEHLSDWQIPGRAAELLGVPSEAVFTSDDGFGLFASANTIEDVRWYAERLVEKYGEEGEKL